MPVRAATDVTRFMRSPEGQKYKRLKLGGFTKFGISTPGRVSQMGAVIGKSGLLEMARVIRPYVTAEDQNVGEPLNQDLAVKALEKIGEVADSWELELDMTSAESTYPDVFGLMAGLSLEACVLLWVLSGSPDPANQVLRKQVSTQAPPSQPVSQAAAPKQPARRPQKALPSATPTPQTAAVVLYRMGSALSSCKAG